jgi:hypothetical protein
MAKMSKMITYYQQRLAHPKFILYFTISKVAQETHLTSIWEVTDLNLGRTHTASARPFVNLASCAE